jgi:micrococcal nuclease
MDRGKYFRILADVYVDGENLTDLLISAGHARPYDGGKREGWCE